MSPAPPASLGGARLGRVERMNPPRSAERQPRLMSAKRAAEYMGLPYTSLRDAAFRGELLVVKVASRWYFDVRDLERFIESHKERLL